jgi:putative copper resistance protein D
MLHLLAISLWAGSVIVFALRASHNGTLSSDQAQRLSQLSTIALCAILISGLLNFARISQVNAVSAWSPYSAWFYAKLACIVIAVALGAYNRWVTMPGVLLGQRRSIQRFVQILQAEALVLIVTIFLAAKLGATMPS